MGGVAAEGVAQFRSLPIPLYAPAPRTPVEPTTVRVPAGPILLGLPGRKETLFCPHRDIVANEVYSVHGIEWRYYR